MAVVVGSVFSGIGAMDRGLELAGFTVAWQIEIDLFCQAVLVKHWPRVLRHGDIREVNPADLPPIDLLAGGPPCQPFSHAGKRRGTADDRHLWPEMLRFIHALWPRWVLVENVAGVVGMVLDDMFSDLADAGYEAQAFVIPACAVGAPHRRDRVWVVAYARCERRQQVASGAYGDEAANEGRSPEHHHQSTGHGQGAGDVAYAAFQREEAIQQQERKHIRTIAGGPVADTPNAGLPQPGSLGFSPNTQKAAAGLESQLERCGCRTIEPRLGGVHDGSPNWLDQYRWPAPRIANGPSPQYDWEPPRVAKGVPDRVNRLRALGNAVVVAEVEAIGRAIMAAEGVG